MIRIASVLALTAMLMLPATARAQDADGPALITVTGKIGTPN